MNNYNITYIAKNLANILNLMVFFVPESHMEMEEQEVKRQSDIYFNSIIFFFRLTGVPFRMNKISTIYSVYMTTVIFCTCSTIIGIAVVVYEHRDDLEYIIISMRVLMPLINDLVIYVYCR